VQIYTPVACALKPNRRVPDARARETRERSSVNQHETSIPAGDESERDTPERDKDDTPDTPPNEPPPVPVQDPPAEPGPQGPYVARQ
jgi:hypothetical protein